MTERFIPNWYLIGNGHVLHYVYATRLGRMSKCGIGVAPNRVYEGYSTRSCQRCVKLVKDNGRRS